MPADRKKLALLTTGYWFLLAYIMAALVWWFISLEQQNNSMAALRLSEISATDPDYGKKVDAVMDIKRRKHAQYVGEGVIFMLLIIVGAVFVYRATRRYLRLGQQQHNFMMAVTHELKTPIAVARLNLETLQRRKLDAAQQEKLLQQALHETDRLNELCNNILLASRFDAGMTADHKEPIDFSSLILNCIEEFKKRFPEKTISVDIAEEVDVEGDALQLKLLINNLLDNAHKYAPRDTAIHIKLQLEGGQARLQVADEGPGIAQEERSRVFEKFYRQGNEATRQKKGTGLGLYLAAKIAAAHGGSIGIEDNIPQGAVFTVTIPTA
ncbi:MAG TPA: HAMP domain-containing sensor histidine kinase [Phnomibacter sp.]|nr:HAMP domain-containing sensor histidine kinase [Phnomibacter sp.]